MISKSHRFIFIHLPKTAGCSIEKSLFPELSAHNPHPLRKNGFSINYQHGTLEEKVNFHKDCASFFSFCVVRNPWDRLVSFYLHISQRRRAWKKGLKPPDVFSFKDMINYLYFKNFPNFFVHCPYRFIRPCAEWVRGITFICKFENLQYDFDKICLKLELDSRTLPTVNSSVREGYASYYDDDLINMVGDLYKKDIEHFGYEFEA